MPTPTPIIEADKFADPLLDSFWKDMWIATAVHNTEIYRKVFRCIPDDLVTSWASYKAFANHAEKFNKIPTDVTPDNHDPTKVTHDGPGTHGAGGGGSGGGIVGQEGVGPNEGTATRASDIVDGHPLDRLKSNGSSNSSASSLHHILDPTSGPTGAGHKHTASRATDGPQKREGHGSGGGGSGGGNVEGKNKRPSGPNEAWQEWEKEEMEILLEEVRGHLGETRRRGRVSVPVRALIVRSFAFCDMCLTVVYPTRFLESEDAANNFLFNVSLLSVAVKSYPADSTFYLLLTDYSRTKFSPCLFTIRARPNQDPRIRTRLRCLAIRVDLFGLDFLAYPYNSNYIFCIARCAAVFRFLASSCSSTFDLYCCMHHV